jgi:hypothetical protein
MKFNAFMSLLLALVLISSCGCKGHRLTSEEACVESLEILSLAAKSYALEKNLSGSTPIDPHDLVGFLRKGQVPICPLGPTPYQAFTLGTGPSCPNDATHTARFRERMKKTK